MKYVWVLTYDDCCELDGAFTTREKARQALKNRIENNEDIRDFHLCDEPDDDFEYYNFKCGYEKVEAIIERLEIDEGQISLPLSFFVSVGESQ